MALERYASDPRASRGRRHDEPPAPTRDAFQRDRDRIVHCTAFRRLVYKTQVAPAEPKTTHKQWFLRDRLSPLRRG